MRFRDKTIEWFIGWLYVLVFSWPLNALFHQQATILTLLSFTVAAWLLAHLFFGTRLGRILFFSLLALATVFLAFVLLSDGPEHRAFMRLVAQYGILFERIYFYEPIHGTSLEALLPALDAFTVFGAAVCIWIFYQMTIHFFSLTAIGITCMIFGTVMSNFQNKIPFLLFCLLTILSYTRFVAIKRERAGMHHENNGTGHAMLQTIPLLLIPLLVVSFMPKSDVPLRWPWLDQKISDTYQFFQQRLSYTNTEFFHFGATGFSERPDRLGGRIRPNNTLVMTVEAEERAYLRGAAYTQYDGDRWSQLAVEDQYIPAFNSNSQDLLELENGWKYFSIDEQFPDLNERDKTLLEGLRDGVMGDVLFPTRLMTIRYKKLTTRTLFMPLKTRQPILDAGGTPMIVTENAYGIGVTELQLPFEYQYHFEYVQPMYGDLLFKQAMQYTREGLYEEALQALTAKEGPNLSKLALSQDFVILRDLADRAARIRATQTTMTVPTTDRVIDLAVELTKDLETDYDKVLAIEAYLRKTYPYTLETHRLPEGKDFVDWFLFEEQKGYCTYFATAMTVMLRSIGIPSRYVEGYIMPDQGATKSNVYQVTNQQAHAWPEVYFEGFGWLTFEPTPSFAGATDFLINPDQMLQNVSSRDLYDLEALIAQYQENYGATGIDPRGFGPIATKSKIPFRVVWIILAVLVFLYLIDYALLFLMQAKSKRKAAKQQVIDRFVRMLRWLKLVGLEIQSGETVSEFGRRTDREFVLNPINFEGMSDLFAKVRYGQMTPSTDERLNMMIAGEDLKHQILKDLGVKRFMPLRRLFLGI